MVHVKSWTKGSDRGLNLANRGIRRDLSFKFWKGLRALSDDFMQNVERGEERDERESFERGCRVDGDGMRLRFYKRNSSCSF